ncbi:MAG: hypothetical protein CMH57_05335 [Myxococcales bacterium]|nr:hypothetical protein [Myxococcales bacterium]
MLTTHAACYNTYFISKNQMEKLEAKVAQEEAVKVIVDGCDTGAAGGAWVQPGDAIHAMIAEADAAATDDGGAAKPAADEGIDPETGCPVVKVNTASPMYVVTNSGEKLRVTPFNFAVTDTQVVSPDYDLLVPISDVKGGEVQTFSGWKTGLMIAGVTALAVGFFVGITLQAGDERQLGEQ